MPSDEAREAVRRIENLQKLGQLSAVFQNTPLLDLGNPSTLLEIGKFVGGREIADQLLEDVTASWSMEDYITAAVGRFAVWMAYLYLPRWMTDLLDLRYIMRNSINPEKALAWHIEHGLDLPEDAEKLIPMWPMILMGASREKAIEAYLLASTRETEAEKQGSLKEKITDELDESIEATINRLKEE